MKIPSLLHCVTLSRNKNTEGPAGTSGLMLYHSLNGRHFVFFSELHFLLMSTIQPQSYSNSLRWKLKSLVMRALCWLKIHDRNKATHPRKQDALQYLYTMELSSCISEVISLCSSYQRKSLSLLCKHNNISESKC